MNGQFVSCTSGSSFLVHPCPNPKLSKVCVMQLAWSQGASGLMEIPSQPSEPLVAAVETAEQTALETSAGPEPSVDSRADERIATRSSASPLLAGEESAWLVFQVLFLHVLGCFGHRIQFHIVKTCQLEISRFN